MSSTVIGVCGILCIWYITGVVAVNLEGPFHSPCLGQVIQLNCSHPFNDGSLFVVWERNGSRIRIEDFHTLDTQTYEIVDINLTSVAFKDKVWFYRCFTQSIDTSVREYSNEVVVDTVEVQLPRIISQQPKSNQIHLEVELKSDHECYRDHVFVFQVTLYQIVNKSLLVPQKLYIFNSTEIAISDLKSNNTYRVGISAKSINSTQVFSDPLWINITTLGSGVLATAFSVSTLLPLLIIAIVC